ncbi:MAG: peptidase [Chromatiaceae bacterium]|nr:MAG: peptidase [Chromatiaceae bacterium]
MDFDLFIILFLLGGWVSARITAGLRLPGILGMVLFGLVFGTFAGAAVPPLVWDLAPFLTTSALIVILLRAGLGIRRQTLARIGLPAILMGVVPCLAEAAALTPAFMWLFDLPLLVAVLAAFVLAAVSPAVVIPSMLALKDSGYGHRADVPTLILAGASLDDVVAITFFTVHLQQAQQRLAVAGGDGAGLEIELGVLAQVPLSIGGGLLVGGLLGLLLAWASCRTYRQIRATEKTLLLMVLALLLVKAAEWVHFAALLAVMTVGFVLLERCEQVAHEVALKLAKVWVLAEIVLFVLIGMAVDIEVALAAGWAGLLVIAIGLAARALGVLLALWLGRARLTWGERLFCVLAYFPKATVQAALGSVPLAAGIPGGELILAVAVLSILVTAPVGLLAIRGLGPRLLDGPHPARPAG